MTVPVALTIAGSDPSGGAGLQADLKTFHTHGVFGTTVVTLLTVQNTVGVDRVETLAPDLVLAQLDAVLEDLPPAAAKTGALGSRDVIRAVAARARDFRFPLIVDPVLISKHGHRLLDDDGLTALRDELLPLAYCLTPNVHEAAALSGVAIADRDGMARAADALRAAGARAVLVKGAALAGEAADLLVGADGVHHWLEGERIRTTSLHGSGCAFSAALTARLAAAGRGDDLAGAARAAKRWIERALRTAPGLGRGVGPLDLSTPGGTN